MPLTILILILISVTMSAAAQLLFKFGMSSEPMRRAIAGGSPVEIAIAALLNPGVFGGLALYGLGTVLWLAVLARTDVSQAYPFVGLGFVLTALIGWLLFGEVLTPTRIGGIALIMAGIVLVART